MICLIAQEKHHHHESHHSLPQPEGYQTLQPPNFDPRFLTSNSQSNDPFTNAHYSHESEPQMHYNLTHETTLYPNESPNYPEIKNTIDYHAKNTYQGSNTHSETDSHSLNTPNYNYNQNDYINSNHVDHEAHSYEGHYMKGDTGGPTLLLETLEPPPVESSLPVIHHIHHSSPPLHRQRPRPKVTRTRMLPPKPFPSSPFPGLDGIFSPNPGYLVRQKFSIYKAPSRVG